MYVPVAERTTSQLVAAIRPPRVPAEFVRQGAALVVHRVDMGGAARRRMTGASRTGHPGMNPGATGGCGHPWPARVPADFVQQRRCGSGFSRDGACSASVPNPPCILGRRRSWARQCRANSRCACAQTVCFSPKSDLAPRRRLRGPRVVLTRHPCLVAPAMGVLCVHTRRASTPSQGWRVEGRTAPLSEPSTDRSAGSRPTEGRARHGCRASRSAQGLCRRRPPREDRAQGTDCAGCAIGSRPGATVFAYFLPKQKSVGRADEVRTKPSGLEPETKQTKPRNLQT